MGPSRFAFQTVRTIAATVLAIAAFGLSAAAQPATSASDYFNSIKDKPPFLRPFLQAMPKGGDLHNHLEGAVYAESFLEWAAADGLCVDMSGPAILRPDPGRACAGGSLKPAQAVMADDNARRELINALSIRDFVPSSGWSASDQFFVAFSRMAVKPGRLADKITRAARRAGHQNEVYLELMVTTEFAEIGALTADLSWAGDVEAAYHTLMKSQFGAELEALVASTRAQYDAADAHRKAVLKCGTADADAGCGVEIRYLYQIIRSMPRNFVFAQSILGFALTKADPRIVGLNFVAPEHGQVALRDYRLHMEMLDFLWQKMGPIDITLHAGELTLGLVRPENLQFHIRAAIETGHAKRIGHGVGIVYEEDSPELLALMAERGILVEINLSSNESILHVKGADHPISLYRASEVPVALSTDDEGVARIDLTHEYQRAVESHGDSYETLKEMSRNSLTYSFLDGDSLWQGGEIAADCAESPVGGDIKDETCEAFLATSDKARTQWELERRYRVFEAHIGRWPLPPQGAAN